MNKDLETWRAGFVRRWHTNVDPRLRNSGDTVGAHTWRVAMLVLRLAKDETTSNEALLYVLEALHHDVDEAFTGDLPYNFKRMFPTTNKRVEDAALGYRKDLGIPEFKKSPIVALADRLDHYLFMLHHAPNLRKNRPWKEVYKGIENSALECGCVKEVQELVHACLENHEYVSPEPLEPNMLPPLVQTVDAAKQKARDATGIDEKWPGEDGGIDDPIGR